MDLALAVRDVLLVPRCAGCGELGSWFCFACRDQCEPVAHDGRLALRAARRDRGRRRDDRRDAEGRGCRGEGGRRPGGARIRRGGRGMTRSRWLVRGLLLFVLAFANLNDIRPEQTAGGEASGLWSPDVLPNALFAWTLIKEHNVDYDEFVFPPTGGASKPAPEAVQAAKEKIDREAYFFRACGVSTATAPPTAKRSLGGPPAPGPNDHVCSVFPPGMGILALPFFAPFVLNGWNPLDLGLLVHGGHVVAAIVEIFATLVLWSVLRRFATPRWSLVLVLLYFLATSVRTVASQALWQHSGVHLAIASALWLVLREEAVPLSRDFAAGLVLGLGAVVRQTTGLVALGLHGFRPTRLIAMLAGAAIGLAPLLAYNDLAFG